MDKSMADIDRQTTRITFRMHSAMNRHDPFSVCMTERRVEKVKRIGMILKMNLYKSANVVLPHLKGVHVEDVYNVKYDIKARRK